MAAISSALMIPSRSISTTRCWTRALLDALRGRPWAVLDAGTPAPPPDVGAAGGLGVVEAWSTLMMPNVSAP